MPGIIVVGSQWGDEGKGKVTDHLADRMQYVVRYQGGNNAGHTVCWGGNVFKLHLVPSGIMYPHITSIVGPGVVVDPPVLLEELEMMDRRGIERGTIFLSSQAHLIMPYHRALEQAAELRLGTSKIGTTGKGIGPAYADKAARIGLRAQDLLDPKIFKEKLRVTLETKNVLLRDVYGLDPMDPAEIAAEFEVYAKQLAPLIADTTQILNKALDEGENVLFEGAQGTMLDVDHGTYPFVTSSSPVAGGACTGAGVSPMKIDSIIGIAKAYLTRVGHGPFPTELGDDLGSRMRDVGQEYGATTGRARRCGWLDALVLRYAVSVNGLTSLAFTKLDVLSSFDQIKVAVAYKYGTETLDELPVNQSVFHDCEPIYEELDGWQQHLSDIRRFQDLPGEAQAFVARVEEIAGIPVGLISVGPDREQTIIMKDRLL